MMQDTIRILLDVKDERVRQTEEYGDQHLMRDGIGDSDDVDRLKISRAFRHERDVMQIPTTWADVLTEEVLEVLAASNDEDLRNELIQVAAVAVQWAEAIDRRQPIDDQEGPHAD